MTPRELPDAHVRRRAATDFDTNLVILAGAGTGKTSLLVERILTAVGSGRVTLDRLAAITFTEKAAGEMRERVAAGLDRLRALAGGEEIHDPAHEADRSFAFLSSEGRASPAEIETRALEAMELLDRATLVTIHSFCSELLRSHPVEAGVDPGFTVDTGEHAEALRESAWERFVSGELGPEAPRADEWKELLASLSLGAVGSVARQLADFGAPPDLLGAPFLEAEEIFGEAVEASIRAIDEILEYRGQIASRGVAFFEGAREALVVFDERGLAAMQRHLGQPARNPDLLGKYKPSAKKVPQETLKWANHQAKDTLQRLHAIDQQLLRRLLSLVAPFALDFREEMLRAGYVSFDGLLALARDLLRDHPRVRERLKDRFRMLLVDEFQDTDPLQYEIALFLAEREGPSATDAYAAELAPGRLFVVGDAKQSVYRFRGADYAACRRAIDRIVEAGGEALDLVGNFRSVPGLIEPVNRLLGDPRGVWKGSDYQPAYVPIEAVRPRGNDEPRVELWSLDLPSNTLAEVRRSAEGRMLAQAIDRVVRQEGRCEFRQITVLFRAFTQISQYLRALRELAIPFVVDGGREFLRRPEVHELMAALGTLAQPADAPSLLAFLRSPAGGVSDVELADYAADSGRWDWRTRDIDAVSFPRIAACFRLMCELHEETRHLSADRLIRRVLDRIHLVPLGAAAFEGAQRVANLRKLATAAGELARNGRLSLEEVVDALREGRLADIETDRPLSDDAAQAVRITSIHRMKGLENDWIFLPDLARSEHRGWEVKEFAGVARSPGGSVGLALKAGGHPNALRALREIEDEQHDHAEEVRVLYVALTRARERLVLLAGPSSRNAPWLKALSPWGFDRERRPEDGERICDGLVLHRKPSLERWRHPEDQRSPENARRAVLAYGEAVEKLREAARPPLVAPSGLHDETERPTPGISVTRRALSRDLGKASGVVLHRLLQFWDGGDPEALRSSLQAICEETARSGQVDTAALVRESRGILEPFLASDLAQQLGRVRLLGHEVPILLREKGQVYNGNIDLLYEDADGRVVVADYKTDRDDDTAAMHERYRDQLGVYARAVRQALELDDTPRAELWLLRSGQRVEITARPPRPRREPSQGKLRF